MKTASRLFSTIWVYLATAALSQAAIQPDPLAPEPTVSVIWVYAFIAAFIGVCVAIGWAIYRADKPNKHGK